MSITVPSGHSVIVESDAYPVDAASLALDVLRAVGFQARTLAEMRGPDGQSDAAEDPTSQLRIVIAWGVSAWQDDVTAGLRVSSRALTRDPNYPSLNCLVPTEVDLRWRNQETGEEAPLADLLRSIATAAAEHERERERDEQT